MPAPQKCTDRRCHLREHLFLKNIGPQMLFKDIPYSEQHDNIISIGIYGHTIPFCYSDYVGGHYTTDVTRNVDYEGEFITRFDVSTGADPNGYVRYVYLKPGPYRFSTKLRLEFIKSDLEEFFTNHPDDPAVINKLLTIKTYFGDPAAPSTDHLDLNGASIEASSDCLTVNIANLDSISAYTTIRNEVNFRATESLNVHYIAVGVDLPCKVLVEEFNIVPI